MYIIEVNFNTDIMMLIIIIKIIFYVAHIHVHLAKPQMKRYRFIWDQNNKNKMDTGIQTH